jgi:hypothetical protein
LQNGKVNSKPSAGLFEQLQNQKANEAVEV